MDEGGVLRHVELTQEGAGGFAFGQWGEGRGLVAVDGAGVAAGGFEDGGGETGAEGVEPVGSGAL